MPRLTKSVIEDAAPSAKQTSVWCSELRGFGAWIQPTGHRTYFVDYRTVDGKRRRIKIGDHGAITAEQARKIATKHIGSVLSGEDPGDEKAKSRKAINVKQLCESYLDAAERGLVMGKRGRPKKASTLDTDRGRIARHIVPLLGTKLVRDLAPADVHRFIRDVTAGKTAIVEKTGLRGKAVVEGGAGAAARTTGLLGGILSFAVSEGVIPMNPAQGVKRPADNRRERRMTDLDYRKLGETLRAIEHERAEADQAIAGTRLLALTGCRLGEIVGLRWSEVDEAGGCFRLEDTKEGKQVRPIGKAAFAVLTTLQRRPGCPYVLAGARSDGPFGGMRGAWLRIVARAGLDDVTPHTLRHGYASVANDLGFTESTVAALLGHAAGTVTGRYIHHVDEVLVAAADRVSVRIATALRGETCAPYS